MIRVSSDNKISRRQDSGLLRRHHDDGPGLEPNSSHSWDDGRQIEMVNYSFFSQLSVGQDGTAAAWQPLRRYRRHDLSSEVTIVPKKNLFMNSIISFALLFVEP